MIDINDFYHKINEKYGTIKRARGCFLYSAKGVRLTDLYQESGRAILGWGSSRFTSFRNVLSRGITGAFESDYLHRLEKAVSSLLSSDRAIKIYASKEDAIRAAISFAPNDTSIWLPWNPANICYSDISSVVIPPPLPWQPPVWITACKISSDALTFMDKYQGICVSPPLLSAITRSIYDIITAMKTRCEKQWFIYDKVTNAYWSRRGPYLYPKMSADDYDFFVMHALDCALVISPDYNTPSIVPYGADAGVFRRLDKRPCLNFL